MINVKHRKLTVLHVATIHQPIKPGLGYGPIETVIYNIDKGLHSKDCRSIVACSGNSRVTGEHYVTIDQSIGDYWSGDTPERRKTMNMHFSMVLERIKKGDIDIIHVHDKKTVESIYDGVFNMHIPIVMTLHLSVEDIRSKEICGRSSNILASPLVYCVPISSNQKQKYKSLVNTEDAIYHGIEVEEYPFKERPDKESYLFSIGRVTRDKGQDKAIEIAKKTGSKLIIAGYLQNKPSDMEFFESFKNSIDLFVDVDKQSVENNYYDKVIKPILNSNKQIIYIGKISRENKKHWYRHARATLFPIQWGEPFGLVLIESMACGTPVIAFNRGAVPEIIVDGKTGFVVNSINEMIEALDSIDSIDPVECRRHVQNQFSITSMATKYSELYQHIIDDHRKSDRHSILPVDYFSNSLQHKTKLNN
jgi:glycosyltransferase involved in cell wall biosynthesis